MKPTPMTVFDNTIRSIGALLYVAALCFAIIYLIYEFVLWLKNKEVKK